MNIQEVIDCIGQTDESLEVQRLFATLGFAKKLKMPKDDIDVRAEFPKLGLSLIFKPESPKSSRLIMSAAKFVSSAEKGNVSFQGDLPSQLTFSDLQADARAKLGPPIDGDPDLRLDIWSFGRLRLAIKYAKAAPSPIAVITVQLPP